MDQRFYASSYGRFNTPDPYQASGGPSDPGSWNRYSYVEGDPVNFFDPQGLIRQAPQPQPAYASPPIISTSDMILSQPATLKTQAEFDDAYQNQGKQKQAQKLCDAAPDGRTVGLNAALGVLGGASGSAEIVFDYHTGNASLIISGGFGASGALAQAGVSAGYIFGAGDSVPNYASGDSVPNYASGGNTTFSASLPGGVGLSVTTNSGGITGNPLNLNAPGATAVQASFAVGLVDLLGGFGAMAQNTVTQIPIGSFLYGPASILAGPLDVGLYQFQSACN